VLDDSFTRGVFLNSFKRVFAQVEYNKTQFFHAFQCRFSPSLLYFVLHISICFFFSDSHSPLPALSQDEKDNNDLVMGFCAELQVRSATQTKYCY
jgi:hypothetical protein